MIILGGNNMIKMIVTSFYNTLIDEEDAIPTSTMFMLDRYKNKGSSLTILCNRLLDEVLYYNHSYPFIHYLIGLNGSLIYDVEKNQIFAKMKLDDSIIEEVESRFSDYSILYYTENEVLEEKQGNIYKIEVKLPKKNKKILDSCKDLDAYCSILEVHKEYYLEISPSTFQRGLELLLEEKKITPEEVLGIIGNDSDTTLISYIPECYVVSNATHELKAKTKKRTKSCTSKGVETLLKKLLKKS